MTYQRLLRLRDVAVDHRAKRRNERMELNLLPTEFNCFAAYMRKDPESPLNIAGSLITSADTAAIVSDYRFARRNYQLAIRLLRGMENKAAIGEGAEAQYYWIFLPQIREMAEEARRKHAQLEPERRPGQLELLPA